MRCMLKNGGALAKSEGLPQWPSSTESARNTGDTEGRVWPLGWENPLEEEMAMHSSILAWRIPMERGAWRGTVAKSRTRLHTQHTLRLGFLPFWCQKGICWTLVQDQFQGRWSQSVSADSDRTRADSKFLKNSLSPHYYSDPSVSSVIYRGG